ncbi:hypothetical protein QR680_006393 [Steinernema hermaphroditum]|uniref:RING-type domain-containing protein n=1 Tax=Steinernema hermaphroditum TaxID=289476 RepID=A0AA39HVE0_9BILA|nr:hypothetical protein QR680_006393 [Steinernema hermaphroditum]
MSSEGAVCFECSICLDLLNSRVPTVAADCGHVFHYDCLHSFTNTRHAPPCPVCQRRVTVVRRIFFSASPSNIQAELQFAYKTIGVLEEKLGLRNKNLLSQLKQFFCVPRRSERVQSRESFFSRVRRMFRFGRTANGEHHPIN